MKIENKNIRNNIYQNIIEQLGKQETTVLITVLDNEIKKYIYNINQFPNQFLENYPDQASEKYLEQISQKHPEQFPENYPEQISKQFLGQLLHSGKQAYEEKKVVFTQIQEKSIIAEPFCRQERLIILGGGHVSLSLAEFSAKTGFSVIVVDDRPSFANSARFPFAKQVICDSFEQAIRNLKITSSDYIAILTRGHRHDANCLRALYEQETPYYLGMIGSKRRVGELKKQLVEEDGISQQWLDSIHSPIGLNIGAITPEEIAVCILAELIETKRRSTNTRKVLQSDIDIEIMEKLAHPSKGREKSQKAILTILETKGSTPRKAGAKMIVYEDGGIEGTIGGGCAEASIMQEAREIIKNGGYKICEVDMTGSVAEDEGMVCGGRMKVLIEKD